MPYLPLLGLASTLATPSPLALTDTEATPSLGLTETTPPSLGLTKYPYLPLLGLTSIEATPHSLGLTGMEHTFTGTLRGHASFTGTNKYQGRAIAGIRTYNAMLTSS